MALGPTLAMLGQSERDGVGLAEVPPASSHVPGSPLL